MSAFDPGTLVDQTQGLANLLPNDRPFYAKNITDSKLRKLLTGLAFEVLRAENRVESISLESDINTTVDLITEWESAFGIPDECFDPTDQTLEQRRNNILAKIKARGVATAQAFIDLAAFMGYTIKIITLADVAYPPYDVPFYPVSLPAGRFIWIIEGVDIAPFTPPYDVPFDINVGSTIIPCFFNKLKPANTILIFVDLPAPP